MSLLAGLDLPTEGQILYDGKSTAERNRDDYRLKAISLICQSYNLFPLLTVEENVTYPMLLRGVSADEAEKTAHEKLKDVGLNSSYYKRLPAMLSGGEQQRVAIAERWFPAPASSLRMSRPATWTPRTVRLSFRCFSGWRTRKATASSSSPTTLPSRIRRTRSCI